MRVRGRGQRGREAGRQQKEARSQEVSWQFPWHSANVTVRFPAKNLWGTLHCSVSAATLSPTVLPPSLPLSLSLARFLSLALLTVVDMQKQLRDMATCRDCCCSRCCHSETCYIYVNTFVHVACERDADNGTCRYNTSAHIMPSHKILKQTTLCNTLTHTHTHTHAHTHCHTGCYASLWLTAILTLSVARNFPSLPSLSLFLSRCRVRHLICS